jgi:hypothetical protein
MKREGVRRGIVRIINSVNMYKSFQSQKTYFAGGLVLRNHTNSFHKNPSDQLFASVCWEYVHLLSIGVQRKETPISSHQSYSFLHKVQLLNFNMVLINNFDLKLLTLCSDEYVWNEDSDFFTENILWVSGYDNLDIISEEFFKNGLVLLKRDRGNLIIESQQIF